MLYEKRTGEVYFESHSQTENQETNNQQIDTDNSLYTKRAQRESFQWWFLPIDANEVQRDEKPGPSKSKETRIDTSKFK